jgi:multicomponent Na+:H+ antiporter subunit B
MSSVILLSAARLFFVGMLVFSVFILLRGHNEPGGGFIGGLAAASAYVIYTLAHGVDAGRRALVLHPVAVTGIGLACAIASGMLPFLGLPGEAFLTHQWATGPLGIKLGTTILFDIGVYLVVVGAVLAILFRLYEHGPDEGAAPPTPAE